MIYLIGGVSKAGKSYVAKRIMEENKIPYFSTDFLLWGLGGVNGDGICDYFDKDSVNAPILKPYILKIVKFLYESNASYVFEGTHITVDLVNDIEKMYPGFSKSVFLGYDMSANDKIEEIIKYENENDNLWYKVLDEETFKSFIKDEIENSKIIKENCIKNNKEFIEVKDIKKDYQIIKNKLDL